MKVNTASAPTTSVSMIDLPINTWTSRVDGFFISFQEAGNCNANCCSFVCP